jgi:hypothetical protein
MPNAKAEVPQQVPGARWKSRDLIARGWITILAPLLFQRQGTERAGSSFSPGSCYHGATPDICKIAQTVAARDDAA